LRAIILLTTLIATGCTTTEYVDRTVEVKVNVPVPCLQTSDIPPEAPYPVDQLAPGDSDGKIIGALLADRTQRAVVEALLRELLTVCTQLEAPQ
jgi:hypothetical protein